MGIELPSRTAVLVAVAVALFVLGGCGGLGPSATPTINDRISWTGSVFEERALADVAERPSYLGYVVEVVRAGGSEPLIVLINAEEGAVSAAPGVETSDGQDR